MQHALRARVHHPIVRSAADVSDSWSRSRSSSSRPGVLTVTLVFLAVTLMLGLIGLSAYEGQLA